MRRVLFLAHFFPPLGGAGVQRSVKFVKYLPALGYEPVVVTGPGALSNCWAPADHTLAEDVPSGTEIVRIAAPEPEQSGDWGSRTERWLEVSRPFSRWWVEETVEIGRSLGQDIDLIYASMSPFESGEAAARLSRELQKPWVADLRDPWALDEMLVYPTILHRKREVARMRATLASAAAIVMNTPEATSELLRRFPEFGFKRVVTISNGYDAEDFSGPPPDRGGRTFRIVHAGFSHNAVVARRASKLLGGAVRGFNVLTRSYVPLLRAVDRALTVHPELRGRLEVHLAGFLSEEERKRNNSRHVVTHGYLTHPETVALLRSANLLFLPLHDLPEGQRARTVPGKTYEYMASGRPILAAVPEGDTRDLLARVGTAFICRPTDIDGMEKVILAEVEREQRGQPPPDPDRHVLARYERRVLTEQLAELFGLVIAVGVRNAERHHSKVAPSARIETRQLTRRESP